MTAISETSLKLQLGLSVSRLEASVEFYTTLLGIAPVRRLTEFARFDVDDPPLVLTLRSGLLHAGGALNHIGYRVEDSAQLVDVQHRLESAGIATQREDDVECCYSRQTKFWVSDPDVNLWEIYSLDDDLEHAGAELDNDDRRSPDEPLPVVWGHRDGEPWPNPWPLPEASVDEIHLDGTLNDMVDESTRKLILGTVFQALKPGGSVGLEVVIDNLQVIPRLTERLDQAGFRGVQIEGVRTIEPMSGSSEFSVHMSAIKPEISQDRTGYFVVYLGPCAEVELTDGLVFRRGERTAVDESTWRLCGAAGLATHFTCVPP